MWAESVRRWVDRPRDPLSWTLGKLPRGTWLHLPSSDEHELLIGPAGFFCLHLVDDVPPTPGDYTVKVHGEVRQLSDRLLRSNPIRVWPTPIGVVTAALDRPIERFGIQFVAGDHLLSWLLTHERRVDADTVTFWAEALGQSAA